MSERDPRATIQDMLEACQRIQAYTKEFSFEKFKLDIKTQDAVMRNLEILGETAKLIPIEISNQFPNLPWREMA